MSEEVYKNYLSDLVMILIDKLEEIKNDTKVNDDYDKGQIMAYYNTLDVIKNQAELFEIPIPELDGIVLEKYLY